MAAVLTLFYFTFEFLKTWSLLLRRTYFGGFRTFPTASGAFLPGIWCGLGPALDIAIENRSRYPVHARIQNPALGPYGSTTGRPVGQTWRE